MDTNPNQGDAAREPRQTNTTPPGITPASAKRSPQLQVSDADVVRELVRLER